MPAPVLELTIIYMKEYHCMRQQCIHQKQSVHTQKKKRSEFKSSPLGLPLTYSSSGSAIECINNSIRRLTEKCAYSRIDWWGKNLLDFHGTASDIYWEN